MEAGWPAMSKDVTQDLRFKGDAQSRVGWPGMQIA